MCTMHLPSSCFGLASFASLAVRVSYTSGVIDANDGYASSDGGGGGQDVNGRARGHCRRYVADLLPISSTAVVT